MVVRLALFINTLAPWLAVLGMHTPATQRQTHEPQAYARGTAPQPKHNQDAGEASGHAARATAQLVHHMQRLLSSLSSGDLLRCRKQEFASQKYTASSPVPC